MTSKRWLGILARHYPSLLVSGVCHKALGEIEDLSKANLRLLGEVSRLTDKLNTTTAKLHYYAASDGLLAPLAAAVLREVEEKK